MRGWRGGLVVCVLVAGCGGPPPEEGLPTEEASAGTEPEVTTEAWCSPTAENTQRVKTLFPPSQMPSRYAPMPEDLVAFRNRVYFSVDLEDGNAALWKSDGTESGTLAVKKYARSSSSGAAVGGLTVANDQLFFWALDSTHGAELWVSDGYYAGTHLVKDLTPGTDSTYFSHMTGLGSTLVFFRAFPETESTAERYELWRSDGSDAGTVRVRDLGPETSVSWKDARLGSALLFFATDSRGLALWKTDGTAAGTVRLKLLDAAPDTASVFDVRTSGSRAYFTLNEPDGSTEVWKTDGTAAGTVRLVTYGSTRDTRLIGMLGQSLYLALTSRSDGLMSVYRLPVEGGTATRVATLPNDYRDGGGGFPSLDQVAAGTAKLYFSVTIGSNGPAPRDTQLWVTDGTSSGTKLVHRPLSLSDEYGTPLSLVSDDLLFFSATESGAGIEPWVTNGTASGTHRLKDIAPDSEGSSVPRYFTKVGSRVFFGAYDETQSGQLWSTKLDNTCTALKASSDNEP